MNIYFENISKKYGSKTAINNFSAHFRHGEVTALLGPSGCGKTTLLNMLAGIITPSEGSIWFDDVKVDLSLIEQYNIGYVFQNFSLYPNMTVFGNISFPLINIKQKNVSIKERRQHIRQKVQEIAQLLKIGDLLDRYPSELSGGQQQRVAIGRALIKKPDILLMDEPFANLDKKLAVELRDEIRCIQKSLGITLVFVTHNQNDATMISDNVVLLNNGIIQQTGKTEELYASPRNLFVAEFFGEAGINFLDRRTFDEDPAFSMFDRAPQSAAVVAFRPEHVNAMRCSEGETNSLSVSSIANNGFYYTISLTSKKGTAVKLFTNQKLEVDQDVLINIEKFFFFDNNGAIVQV